MHLLLPTVNRKTGMLRFFGIEIRKGAKIRNRYNQAPHLTKDTKWESGSVTSRHHKREQGKHAPHIDQENPSKLKRLEYIYTLYVSGKLGQGGEHTFIRKTAKHLHLSICIACILHAQIVRRITDHTDRIRSILHSLMVKQTWRID